MFLGRTQKTQSNPIETQFAEHLRGRATLSALCRAVGLPSLSWAIGSLGFPTGHSS